jgi:predicted Zn-dependent peptidase
LDDLIDRFKSQKVDAQSLARVKAQLRASVLRRLGDNSGLAELLTSTYANYGDWRKLFTMLDEYGKVTADDVQRVARKYFTLQNRTVAYAAQPAAARPPAAGGRQ